MLVVKDALHSQKWRNKDSFDSGLDGYLSETLLYQEINEKESELLSM